MILDAPQYSGDIKTKSTWKIQHGFLNPEGDPVSAFSTTQIIATDFNKYFVGAECVFHNSDYSIISDSFIIDNIFVNLITFNGDISAYTGFNVSLIGFKDDNGSPYRYI